MAGFLVATWDGGGNTVPTVAIARELQERGHRVRVLGLTSQVDAFRAEGLDLLPYPSAGDFPIGGSPLAVLRLISNRAMGRDAVAALAADPADLVVVDTALFGVMDELRRAGHRYAVLGHTFDGFLRATLRPSAPVLRPLGLRPLRLLDASRATMVASIADLDAGHGDVVHIGPVLRAEPAGPTEPLVLVSLSTVGFRDLARTWQKVLDAVEGLEARVVATIGPAVDLSKLRVPENVEVHRWLPHAEILPRVSVVVSHGGHGTAMAALAHGVPLLILPVEPTSDQPFVGRAVARSGAGLTLSRRSSTAAIRAALDLLLADGYHRVAAAALGADIRELDGRQAGADLLEALLEPDGRQTPHPDALRDTGPANPSPDQRPRRLRARRDRGPVTSAVGVDAVPTTMLGLSRIDAPDYADAFTLSTPGVPTGTAESWARAMFGDTPSIAERFIFQVLLRLELSPFPSRDTIAGFIVAERTPERIRLEAVSTLLTCHLVVQVHTDGVSLATFMKYHRRAGRAVWTVVSAAHRRLAPGLLRDAAEGADGSQRLVTAP